MIAGGLPGLAVRAATSPLSDVLGAASNLFHGLLMMPEQASTMAPRIDALQFLEFAFLWVIAAVTLGAGGWLAWRYHRRAPLAPDTVTPEIRAPLWLEGVFAGVLLVAFLVFWVIGYRQYVDASLPPAGAMEVYVTGKQWMWKFAYADGPTSAGTLYVPLGRPVRLMLTSRDVIHSLFVPAFRLKQDAVPGRYTSIWFTATRLGRYDILCAEFCGAGHSRMWGEVVVLPEAEFERWLSGARPQTATGPVGESPLTAPAAREGGGRGRLAVRGVRIAGAAGCLRCHTLDGGPTSGRRGWASTARASPSPAARASSPTRPISRSR